MGSTRTASEPGAGPREGRGRLLAAAFDEAERLPALQESRDRALELISHSAPSAELAVVIEPDVGLTVAVVRAAGALPEPDERLSAVSEAVEALGPERIADAVRAAPTYDFFEPNSGLALDPDPFRLHALAVQRAADQIADAIGTRDREELALAALLHDIGRPALARLHPGYAERFDRRGDTSDNRITAERRELGIDHALVGGVIARRWGLHARVAEAIERHHSSRAEGAAAVIDVADRIAAYTEGCPVSREGLDEAAKRCGLAPEELRKILYELPQGNGHRRRVSGPCPLSARELEVLQRLAEGKVYKQIAYEMSLSASTVRSHLHNVYGKLGALDRAQAVLMASEHGWI